MDRWNEITFTKSLAHTFGVNRSTIVMAFGELVAKGYIEGNGRKGTIVVNNNENASTYAPRLIGSLM